MIYKTATVLLSLINSAMIIATPACAASKLPQAGDWIRYKVMRAGEFTPTPIDTVTLTIGPSARIEGTDAVWWQMSVKKTDGSDFVVQALSERAPMSAENGDIGIIFRYIFRQADKPALEFVNETTGLAYLPMFGFREALIPTPRFACTFVGPFLSTGNYLGQALAAHAHGTEGKWLDLQPITKLVLNDDVLVGTARMFKDDGSGPDEDKEYKYVELTANDYEKMIEAGFNLFMVNDKHIKFVRERPVFFIKGNFSKDDPYPELLYRSNYWGTAMFTDEPAVRLDTSDCRSVYDAANLLRLRNYTYHLSPGSHVDEITRMILNSGFNVGDWKPEQLHIPVWETAYETSFYQMQGGAAGLVHEGRYVLKQFNNLMELVLGGGAEVDLKQMYDLHYCFMRGAARCFGKEWGTAIYGQCDPAIAPDAIRQAYDMGAHFIWFWTSDHDHHVPFTRQLELARLLREYQKKHPRPPRHVLMRKARVAVAAPDGYCLGWGTQWGNQRFAPNKLNEFGVAYGDVNAECYWQMFRLAKQGIDFDAVIDVPEVIERAGYEQIIRVRADATTNLPNPRIPAVAPKVSIKKSEIPDQYQPKPNAPKTKAFYAKPGSIKIDGDLSEWKNAQWIDLEQQYMYEVTHDKWGGEQDISAQVAFAYDENAIYIAAKVRDDVMLAEETGDLIWQNDSLQVAFDPFFNPHSEGYYAIDDNEIGFSLVNGVSYAHTWTPPLGGGPSEIPGSEIKIIRSGEMTVYEARVPFSSLSPLTPSFPGRCGVNAAVNDSDTKHRKGAIAWTSGLVDGKNPSRFGVLEFEGAEKLVSALPIAFAQPERTVVKRGENVVLRMDTGARQACDAEVTITVSHGASRTSASIAQFKIPTGMASFRISIDTSSLESDSYKAHVVVTAAGKKAGEQSFRFYVLP